MKSHSSVSRMPGPFWCLLLAALAAAPGAGANVMPEALVLVHVAPNDWSGPGLGPAPEIQLCEDVQQFTSHLGRIECDLVLYPIAYLGQNLLIHSIETTVRWPETWQFLGYQRCNQAQGYVGTVGNEASIDLRWSPPRFFPSEAFLVVRLLFDAPDPGQLEFVDPLVVPFELGELYSTFTAYAFGVPGRAGELCSDCRYPCGSLPYCEPSFDQESVEIIVPPESATTVTLTAYAGSGAGPGFICPLTLEASEPWMSLAVTQLEWYIWQVDVTVNTAGLPSGAYEGWLRGTTWCTACVPFQLTVTGTAGVEESIPQPTSWGRIKHGFR